jgi:hypothetical protein
MAIEVLAAILIASADETIVKLPPPTPRSSAATCPFPLRGEIVAFERLPPEVLADLRRVDPKISPPGGPFNAGDVIDGATPGTRIIGAMRLGDRMAAAYEKGGWGYSVTVVTYRLDPATERMVVAGLHTLNGRDTARGWVMAEDACPALLNALDGGT